MTQHTAFDSDRYREVLLELIPKAMPDMGVQWKTHCVVPSCPSFGRPDKKHLHINEENGRGICFRCETHYTFTWFVQLFLKISRDEAIKLIYGTRAERLARITAKSCLMSRQRRVDVERPIIPAVRLPAKVCSAKGNEYLHRRGISDDIIEKMGLLLGLEGIYRDRIITPIRQYTGKVIGYSARATYKSPLPKRFSAEFPRKVSVSNEHIFMRDNKGFIVLVEGELGDVASVMRVTPYVGATFGMHVTMEQCVSLSNLGIRKAFVMFDGSVEDKFLNRAAKRLTYAGITPYVAKIPDKNKDPGDLSAAQVLEVLRNSKKVRELSYA